MTYFTQENDQNTQNLNTIVSERDKSRQEQLPFSEAFFQASNRGLTLPKNALKRRMPPLSIRLTGAEKADLAARAGDVPVSAYAKSLLFADGAKALRLSPRNPLLDHQVLGQILAQLGRAEIAPDLAVLADAVRSGSLPLDEVTASQIERSCADIAMIRLRLMEGLGMQGV